MLLNGTSVGSKNKLKPPYLPSTTSQLRRHVLDWTRIKADKERNSMKKQSLGKPLWDLTKFYKMQQQQTPKGG